MFVVKMECTYVIMTVWDVNWYCLYYQELCLYLDEERSGVCRGCGSALRRDDGDGSSSSTNADEPSNPPPPPPPHNFHRPATLPTASRTHGEWW